MPSPACSPRGLTRSRLGHPVAIAVVFGSDGLLLAQAAARMPSIRDHVGASTEQLGFALLAMGLGSLVAMPWTGRLADRWGSRMVATVATVVAAAGWAVVPLVPSVAVLGVVLFCIGAPVGMWDVAMNVQGHHVEQRRGRSLMPWFHGSYSGGMVLGALLGAGAARLGLGLAVQLPALSAAMGFATLASLHWFVPDSRAAAAAAGSAATEPPTEPPPPPELGQAPGAGSGGAAAATPGRRRGVTGLEVVIGLVCLSTALGEGAANDWLALLLVDVRHAAESIGAVTFAAFNVTMMLGRFAGSPAIERFGRVAVLRASGLCAATGVVLVCLVPSVPVAVLGGLLWGLGLATVFPATMSAAGEVPGRGPRAIGVVSSIGYGAFLFGAPTIGVLSARVGLDRALLLIAAFAVLIVALSGFASARRIARSGAVPGSGRSLAPGERPGTSKLG